jgi:hypothetical protein
MKQNIDAKLIAILFLMNEVSKIKNNLMETSTPKVIEDNNTIDEVIADIDDKYNLAYKNIKNPDQARQYELALSDYITYILRSNNKIYNEDEINLMQKSKNIDNSSLNNFRFTYANSDFVRDIFNCTKTSSSGIRSWLISPDYISLFESNKIKNYLCTKKIKKISGEELILFYHISQGPNKQVNEGELTSIFFVHYNYFKDMLSNPVRLFLFILDNYGLEIECKGKISHFIIETFYENLNMKMSDKGRSFGQIQSRNVYNDNTRENNNLIIFSYGIDIDKYINEFNKRMI